MRVKDKEIVECFKKLIGEANVTTSEEKVLMKPASAGEVQAVLQLAAEEEIAVEVLRYMVGRNSERTLETKFVLSLERMNRVFHFDRENFFLHVEPAVTVEGIKEMLTREDLLSPAKDCRNNKETIGENVVICFEGGKLDFKCLNACLCGLEMVLLTGEMVTIGGSCIMEVHNYDLSYLLSGYTGEPAVVTGIHLKIMPPETFNSLLLVIYEKFDDVLKSLSSLNAQLEFSWEIIAIENTPLFPVSDFLKRYLPDLKKQGAYVMFNLKSVPTDIEGIVQKIEAVCLANGAVDILIASASQDREEILLEYNSFLTDLKKQENYYEKDNIKPLELATVKEELEYQDNFCRLKAVFWQSPPESLKLFYVAPPAVKRQG